VPSGLPWRLHLPAVPAMELRVASILPSFGGTLQRSSGLPRLLALSVPPPDTGFGSPRFPHLPAAGDGPSSLPEVTSIWRYCSLRSGLPLRARSYRLSMPSPGCPGSCIFRLRLERFLRVAPLLHSPGAVDWWSSESPRTLHRSACQRLGVRVAPYLHSDWLCRLCVSGFPRGLLPRLDDDDSPLFSNLASTTRPGRG
jgi:hypothetical protein